MNSINVEQQLPQVHPTAPKKDNNQVGKIVAVALAIFAVIFTLTTLFGNPLPVCLIMSSLGSAIFTSAIFFEPKPSDQRPYNPETAPNSYWSAHHHHRGSYNGNQWTRTANNTPSESSPRGLKKNTPDTFPTTYWSSPLHMPRANYFPINQGIRTAQNSYFAQNRIHPSGSVIPGTRF